MPWDAALPSSTSGSQPPNKSPSLQLPQHHQPHHTPASSHSFLPKQHQPVSTSGTPSTTAPPRLLAPNSAGQGGPANGQGGPANGQGLPGSGHKLPSNQQTPASGQGPQDSRQMSPLQGYQAPGDGQKGQNTGHKRPSSGQGVLETAVKRSRQTTLDNLKHSPALLPGAGSSDKTPRQLSGSRRQAPLESSQPPVHQMHVVRDAGHKEHFRLLKPGISPHTAVAQVLDLTEADDEAMIDNTLAQQGQKIMQVPVGSSGAGPTLTERGTHSRRQSLKHPHRATNSTHSQESLVDLT